MTRLSGCQTQLADWLEFYAEAMELNVWTSAMATHAQQDKISGKWHVTVKRGDGSERIFHVDHVVFALGLGGSAPNIPNIPGRVRSIFIIHSPHCRLSSA